MASPSSVNPPDHNTTVSSQVTLTTSTIVAPPDGGLYDVFLNFRGETRTLFIDHLYNVLQRSQLRVYLDTCELLPGGVISEDLRKAIKNSKTYVVVFSKDYAGSPWCLNELVQIYKCYQENKNLVIGVYYHIIPDDVRRQNGSFDKSFKKYEKFDFTNEMDLVNEWRGALTGVANLSGLKISAKSLTEIQGLENLITSIRELGLDGCNSSLHANILTTPFFQIWSQVGSRIIISVEELPSWFPFIHDRVFDYGYTIPSDVGQISSMIICLEHNCNDEDWDYECDVENVTTGEKYSDYGTTLWGLIHMIILPTSIISLREGDEVRVTSDGLVRGIHLV